MTVREEPTEEAIAKAKENPGGWVYKIDGECSAEPVVPPEAIVGAWKVDSKGKIVGPFVPNPNYRPAS